MLFTPSRSAYPADQLVRSGNITNGEIISTSGFAGPVRQFKVTLARAVFHPKDGAWHCGHVTIGGQVLKKDGTPGKVYAENYFPLDNPETPKWVREIVRHLQPTVPAPSMQMETLTLD